MVDSELKADIVRTSSNSTSSDCNSSSDSENGNKLQNSRKRPAREIDFRLKYKTEICRNWETGFCEFGDKCAFAHGADELRQKTHLSSNYKTKKCKQFYELGYCMYGNRCQFRHKEESPSSKASTNPSNSLASSRKSSEENSSKRRLPIFVDLEVRGFIES